MASYDRIACVVGTNLVSLPAKGPDGLEIRPDGILYSVKKYVQKGLGQPWMQNPCRFGDHCHSVVAAHLVESHMIFRPVSLRLTDDQADDDDECVLPSNILEQCLSY